MKNLGILIFESFFLGLTFLKKVRQSINHSISFSLTIIDLDEVVLKELLGPVNLARAQNFHIHKLVEVIIVSKDENLIFTAFQVIASSFKGFNNSQKL